MKNLLLACVVALAFCPMAAVADIAISTQAGWFGQAAADREMQEIADNVTAVPVELFAADNQAALADWVVAHTGDGVSDLLILCGNFPDSIYPPGNAQPDGSLAELFLDDGNIIINTGDYMFYVNSGGTNNNATGGLYNMMDIVVDMWDDNTPANVTADGQALTPTLVDFQTDRPFHLDQLQGPWFAELILAQNDAGTRADPVIVANVDTGGRLGIFYQTAGQDDDPRGEVISEWINNWYLTAGEVVNPGFPALSPDPADGAVDVMTPLFKWTAGYGAVMHEVYFGTSPDLGAADFKGPMPVTLYFHLEPLEPGATYYWRVDEVRADGGKAEGDVWSFTVMPLEAHFPSPYDGAVWVATDATFSWAAGQGAVSHRIYGGTDEAAIAAGDPGALLGEKAETTFNIAEIGLDALELDTTYYWRVDEIDGAGAVVPGPVWTFTTPLPGYGTGTRELWEGIGGVSVDDLLGAEKFLTCAPDTVDEVTDFKSPDLGIDNYGGRLSAWVHVPVAGDYTFWVAGDDNCRLYLGADPGQAVQIAEVPGWTSVDAWDWYAEQKSAPISLAEGDYFLQALWKEGGGGDSCSAAWQGPAVPNRVLIAGRYLAPYGGEWASAPSPLDGATGVADSVTLTWCGGAGAASYNVYLGTAQPLPLGSTVPVPDSSFTPPEPLEWGVTYLWRVDAVDEAGNVKAGPVWSFTVEDTRILEDFEAYDIVPIDPVGAAIAHYAFEGDYEDISGNGHHGTPVGDISIVEDPVMGQVLKLPGGDNQFVDCGAVGLSGNDPTTIACWAKADHTSIPDWTLIFGFTGTADGQGGNGSHFNIGSLGGPGGVGAHCWGWEETIFSDEEALEWHHYAMTYDGTTILYYGDGVLKDTDPGKSNVQDLSIRADRVHIGSRITQASSFPGQVDDARVYDYTLSLAEIGGLAGFIPTNPVSDVWADGGTAVSAIVAAPAKGSKALQISYGGGPADVSAVVGSLDLSRGPSAVMLSVHGSSLNSGGSMYVAMEDTSGKLGIVPVIGSADAVMADAWTDLLVSLDDFRTAGVDVANVAKVAVAVDGGTGAIVIDNLGTTNTGQYVPRNWPITVDLAKTSMTLTGTDRQLTDYAIQVGETFTLKLRVRVTKGVIWDGKNLKMALYYDDGSRVTVASKSVSCAEGAKEYSVSFNSSNTPGSDDNPIGVELVNLIGNTLVVDKIGLTAK